MVHADEWRWVDSPQAGVQRVMLDRVGDEVAVATSFVRYAPESRFPAHDHPLGEEFLVLEGEFGDEHGRYPPGSYVRNPPGSRHAPFSDPGCLIWVKLRQFRPDDLTECRTRLDLPIPESGVSRRVLHSHGDERVAEVTLAEGAHLSLNTERTPQEMLVLAGRVLADDEELDALDWLRLPAGNECRITALAPSRLFWKTRPVTDPGTGD
jgi:quercetin dioxygenase-like cupin family protein